MYDYWLGILDKFSFFLFTKPKEVSKYVNEKHKKRKRYEERKRRHKTEPPKKLSCKPIVLLKKGLYKMDMMSRPDVA